MLRNLMITTIYFVNISTDSFKSKFKPKDLMQFNLAVGEINELQRVQGINLAPCVSYCFYYPFY